MCIEQLEAFATAKGLKFALDPFHGATAYEYQKAIGWGKCICAGCIYGPTTSVLYTRVARRGGTENYKEHERTETINVDERRLTKFVAKQLAVTYDS